MPHAGVVRTPPRVRPQHRALCVGFTARYTAGRIQQWQSAFAGGRCCPSMSMGRTRAGQGRRRRAARNSSPRPHARVDAHAPRERGPGDHFPAQPHMAPPARHLGIASPRGLSLEGARSCLLRPLCSQLSRFPTTVAPHAPSVFPSTWVCAETGLSRGAPLCAHTALPSYEGQRHRLGQGVGRPHWRRRAPIAAVFLPLVAPTSILVVCPLLGPAHAVDC